MTRDLYEGFAERNYLFGKPGPDVETNEEIPLHKVDYRELPQHFNERLDAVVCWSASIIHVEGDDDGLRAFQSTYEFQPYDKLECNRLIAVACREPPTTGPACL